MTFGYHIFLFEHSYLRELANSKICEIIYLKSKQDWPGHKVNKKGKEEEEKNIQKIATKFQKNRVDILLSKLQRNHPHIFFQTHHSREPIKVLFLTLIIYKSIFLLSSTWLKQKLMTNQGLSITEKVKLKMTLDQLQNDHERNNLQLFD